MQCKTLYKFLHQIYKIKTKTYNYLAINNDNNNNKFEDLRE